MVYVQHALLYCFRIKDTFFWCPTRLGDERVPRAVSLVQDKCVMPLNLLRVHNEKISDEKRLYNITLCLGPMYNQYNDLNRLVEMVEVDTMLGVDLIVVYNISFSSELNHYIGKYAQDGIMHIYDFYHSLLNETWYYAQRVLINDCVYRYMFKSDYIVIKDVDEIIVPRGNYTTLQQLLANISQDNISEYNIRHVCFPDEMNNISRSRFKGKSVDEFHMRTILNVNRSSMVMPPGRRSKYIINPRLIYEADIHTAVRVKGVHNNVSPEYALVHHYRTKLTIEKSPQGNMVDITMYRFTKEIQMRIRKRHIRFKR